MIPPTSMKEFFFFFSPHILGKRLGPQRELLHIEIVAVEVLGGSTLPTYKMMVTIQVQNNPVPKNSYRYNFSAGRGRSVLYESHSSPSYSQPPAQLYISAVLRSTCAQNRIANALPAPCSPSAGQGHGTPLQDSCGVDRKAFFDDISVSILQGTHTLISCGLSIVCCL